MNCPLYKDYTRFCVEKFHKVVYLTNFEFCDSERYQDCPFYKILERIEPLCPYIEDCPMYFHIRDESFNQLMRMTKTYCCSENYSFCARYKLRESGEKVPRELYPDGTIKKD